MSPRFLARLLAVAFALLLAASMAVVITLLHQINRDAEQAAVRTMSGAVQTQQKTIISSTFSTSRWDEAVQSLYGKLDPVWALSNLGLSETRPEHVYVIDGKGRTLFAVHWDRKPTSDLRTASPDGLAALRRLLPTETAAAMRGRTATGFVARHNGRPAFFAAAPILPQTGRVAPPRGGLRYVVHVAEITPRLLEGWASAYHVDRLRLVDGDIAHANAALALPLVGGAPAHIEWTAPAPARSILKRLGLLIGTVVLLFAIIAYASIRMIVHSSARLVTSRHTAHKLAGQAQILAHEAELNRKSAEDAQKLAEEALDRSRADRARIEAMSREEMRERERHARQLRDATISIAARIEVTALALTARLTEAARALDGSASAAMDTINRQHEQALAITDGTRRATATIRGVLDRMRSVGTRLLSVSEETRDSRSAIETCMTLSVAARDSNRLVQDQVEQVGKAAEAIAEVTARTRTLALNAAIEAARAGESGQSFAVVANEVKALAGQIDQLNRTVATMARSMGAAASKSWSQSDSVRDALASLNQSAALTIETILSQQTVTQQLVEASDDADGTAQRIADDSGEILASLDKVRAQSGHMQASARDMRADVESLSDMLSEFVADLRAAG